MEIPIDEEWLKALYEILVSIYKDTERPVSSGFPLVLDFDESMISVCVERHKTKVFGKNFFPHILQRAAVLMHSIINFHPFVDGNKRAALLSVDFYLHWNGYDFMIPEDADDFTISIAKGEQGLNDILRWLERNTQRTPFSVVRHWLCQSDAPTSKRFKDLPNPLFFPIHALAFFRNKIIEEQYRKAEEEERRGLGQKT